MRFRWMTAGSVVAVISHVVAQEFNIPSSWSNTTSNLTRQDRLDLVDGVLNTVVRTLSLSSGLFGSLNVAESAHMTHSIATIDYINKTSTYESIVREALNATFTSTLNNTQAAQQASSDVIQWGVAAISAYRAYQDASFMGWAESAWDQGTTYLVSPENAASGTHPTKNASFSPACNGATIAGAVFNVTNAPDNLDVDADTVGSLFVLSARLYEYTSDTKYLTAAQLMFDFINHHLFNGNVILDGIVLGTCQTVTSQITSNSGWVVDGLSTPKFVATNGSYASFLSGLVSTAVPNPAWTSPSDGVIIEGQSVDPTSSDPSLALKGIYIRGLYERYMTIPSDSPEAAFIRSHITVQFNALMDLASTPASNQYSPQWQGPPPFELLPLGQLAALDVLVSALGLTFIVSDNTTSPTTPSGPSGGGAVPTASDPLNTAVSVGSGTGRGHPISNAAIGGIAAGGALLVLLGISFILLCRRRRRQLERRKLLEMETAPQPYSESEVYDRTQPLEDGQVPPTQPRTKQFIASKHAEGRSSHVSRQKRRGHRPQASGSTGTPSGSVTLTSPSSGPRHTRGLDGAGSQGSSSVVVDLTSHPRLFARLARAAQAMESAPHITSVDREEVDDEDLPRYER